MGVAQETGTIDAVPSPAPAGVGARRGRRLAIAEQLGIACETLELSARLATHAGGWRLRRARADIGQLGTEDGAQLLWAGGGEADGPPAALFVQSGGSSIPIFAHALDDRAVELLLAGHRGAWSRVVALTDGEGERVASIWRADDGSVFLPFDPDEVCLNCWSERYMESLRTESQRRTHDGAIRSYYLVRGLLPRPLQIWLRRRYARRQARTPFPRWPAETALHDFHNLFTAILAEVAGQPVPRIAPWPHDHTWAFVLTHDVETAAGLAALGPICELERSLGLRSSWNVVPRRYETGDDRIRELIADGFEVGVHGLYHDGRDLESRARVQERLPSMREAAERWEAVGFRSPGTQRSWELMELLGFDYDSSYPDTDPFEPQGGGCCTWLPFFNGELVELPLTMPQDHTIFVILGRGEEPWFSKAEFLRERGGMALIDAHPDYLVQSPLMSAYRRLLERYADDESAWKALPREVSAWWRRRAASRVEQSEDGTWVVTGPAADEARVELVEGGSWR
jgi:hypothetical protein